MFEALTTKQQGSEDAEFAGHLRWMSQKMELGQGHG